MHFDTGKVYDPEKCHIRRSTGGISASLTSVKYECLLRCIKIHCRGFDARSIAKIGFRCSGSRPWLGIEKDSIPCSNTQYRVVQRGATNVWFPDVRSSIYIPTDDDNAGRRIIQILTEF